MPRPKKIPEFQEGPQAAENFKRLMQTLVRKPSRVLVSERLETTTVQVTEEKVLPPQAGEKRRKGRNT